MCWLASQRLELACKGGHTRAGQLGSCHEGVVQDGWDSSSSGTETIRGRNIRGHVASWGVRRLGEGVCYNNGCPRHVDNFSCTFSDECKLMLLQGGPRFRDSVEGHQQWFLVSPQLELAAPQSLPEVMDGSEGGQQLPVKSEILTLHPGQLLGEEAKRPPTVFTSRCCRQCCGHSIWARLRLQLVKMAAPALAPAPAPAPAL